MLGSRGIYHHGWKAVTFHPLGAMYDDGLDPDAPFDDDVWELYDVVADPSETNDLAAAEPERLAAMVDLWWEEAARNDVLPLDNRPLFAIMNPRPTTRQDRDDVRLLPERRAGARAGRGQRAQPLAHDHRDDHRARRASSPEGTLLALGSVLGGFTLQLVDGRLALRAQPLRRAAATSIDSDDGRRRRARTSVAFAFTKTAEFTGRGELLVDGDVGRRGRHPALHPDDVLLHRRRAHVRLRGRARDRRRLRRAVPRQRRRSTASSSTCPGTPHRDPAAEFDAIMSEQ